MSSLDHTLRRRQRAARSGKAWPWSYKYASGLEALDAPPLAGPPELDQGRMYAGCVLMTEARDREGDVMLLDGVDTTAHQRLPVVMIDHGQTGWPFAVGLNRTPEGVYTVTKHPEERLMRQGTYFRQDDETAMQIYDMVCRGMMGSSIGYRPIEWSFLKPDVAAGHPRQKDGSGGKLLARVEMTESTWTCQPANAECVRDEWDRNRIDGKSLTPAVRAMLKPWLPPRKATLFVAGKGKSMAEEKRPEKGKKPDREQQGEEEESPHADEPYGSQLMKSMHADAAAFHETYGKACKALEHKGVKRWAFKMLNSISDHMAEGHKVHGKYYKAGGVKAIEHMPPTKLDHREHGEDEDEEKPEGEEESVAEGKADEDDMDEETAGKCLVFLAESRKELTAVREQFRKAAGV